jgi:hypothetical protein
MNPFCTVEMPSAQYARDVPGLYQLVTHYPLPHFSRKGMK